CYKTLWECFKYLIDNFPFESWDNGKTTSCGHDLLRHELGLEHQRLGKFQASVDLSPYIAGYDYIHRYISIRKMLPKACQVLRKGRLGTAIYKVALPSPDTRKRRYADNPFQMSITLI